MSSRPAAVAGRFYPGSRRRLVEEVDRLLSSARRHPEPGASPVGLIVPHAGYRYSGPVAAAAYAQLAERPEPVERVVIVGPSHFVAVAGCAVPATAAFDTPSGPVPVDTACCSALARRTGVVRSDAPHDREHAIEVQLPFLVRVLPAGWRLVPVAVGRADPSAVADLLEAAVGPSCLVVCSTDLSHYLDHDTAVERDRRTAEAIVARRAGAIGDHDACGAAPLRGILTWAERHNHPVRLLDLRTSGHTAGDRSRVVGYGAFTLLP
jgi:AmmeMemoRadiSam system protein B